MTRIRAGLGLLAIVLVVAACERPKELRVPLDYRPTDRLAVGGVRVPPGLRLAVNATDARTDASEIGRNAEGTPPVPVYAASPPPETFVRDGVARELSNAGIQVESDPHRATKILNLRLQRFWTDETSTYKTTIMTDAQLTDPAGHRVWQGVVSGNNERFGRSLKAENYQESLSDAVVNLVGNLLGNSSFVDALNAPAAPVVTPRSHRR